MSNAAEAFLRARRSAVKRHATQIGLDFIVVLPDPEVLGRLRLELHFLPAGDDPNSGKYRVLDSLAPANLHLTAGGVPVDGLFRVDEVEHLTSDAPVVTVTVAFAPATDLARRLGRAPVLTLELVDVSHVDPFFSRLDFSLDPEVPLAEDCQEDDQKEDPTAAEPEPLLAGDYLARDFASFRQKMLDHLAQKLPGWTERSPADLLVTLVELLADAGDRASYYQDAVATEAYLGTARLRTSVRRHARLVGYRVHEGAAARVWVHLTADAEATLPAGTRLLTPVPGFDDVRLSEEKLKQALQLNPEVFETLEEVSLWPERNEMKLYAWGADEFALAPGATSATLEGRFPELDAGDVLILEQVDDETRRQAVRLTRVEESEDPVGPDGTVLLTGIEWHPEDALRFPLAVAPRSFATIPLAVARGNVVLAGHGRRAPEETLTVTPGCFRPRLRLPGLTWRAPWDAKAARDRSAASALNPDRRQAVPAIELSGPGRTWNLKSDLLGSDRFADDFVVEMEDDGTARLRFGDGTLGRPPASGTVLTAIYRVGNGILGNIGRDNLAHLVSDSPEAAAVTAVRNPLPAAGGTDPEPLDSVRLAAPGFIEALEQESTLNDVAVRVEADPYAEVERAEASLRWTGGWYVLELAVQRKGRLPVDAEYVSRLRALLEDVRIAGWELAILPLSFVGLDIALTVFLDPDVSRGRIEKELLDTFSDRDLSGGRRGFFHPANLDFGQPVYLSRIVETALTVPGVRAVDFGETPPRSNRFRRFGEPSHGELTAGRIRLRRGELPRVDNDPAAPENGRIHFFLEGGR